jgi:glyceraldehyde 3-phosphate dehydrogenase
LNRTPDRDAGRGLNPTSDEHGPALDQPNSALSKPATVRRQNLPNHPRIESRGGGTNGRERMSVRVGVNGFGRIGRNFFRAARKRGADIELIAVNDLGDAKTMAHLLKYDSVLGPLGEEVEPSNGGIRVGDAELRLLNEKDPAALPWKDLDVQVVLESTGLFTKREDAQKHLDAGAEKVVISAPATDPDVTIVLGVNGDAYDKERHRIVSNASCTTNCVAPLAKVLNDAWGIESGFMTTIHAYTNDQQILDLPHKDLRRARAAGINLIPTSTGAAKAIGLVIPELQGKVDGISIRAPVADGSIVDLVAHLGSEVEVDAVNAKFAESADKDGYEGILQYSDDPIVSTDVIGSEYSSIFDSELTMAKGNEVKVFGWYDNEWGYSCRLVDLVQRLL